ASGPDTTGGQHSAQGAPNVGSAPSHEIVANLGIDRFGRSVSLAQEPLPNDAATRVSPRPLIVLYPRAPHATVPELETLRSVERAGIQALPDCYVCATPHPADARFCEACGATLSIVVDGPAAGSPYALLQSKELTQGATTIIGEIASTDGRTVYFAREQSTGQ